MFFFYLLSLPSSFLDSGKSGYKYFGRELGNLFSKV